MNFIKILLAICLVCGFSVGSGFLTLTATVGLSGFWGGVIALILIWLLGIASGLLYLEAFLAADDAKHLVSLCKRLAGPLHTVAVSFFYLFFSYSTLIVCYIFMSDLLHVIAIQHHLPPLLLSSAAILIITLLFAVLVYHGHFPTLCVIALLFLTFVASLGSDIFISQSFSLPPIGRKTHWLFMLFSIGAIFNISFYQSILPTLIVFLKRQKQAVLISIWTGFSLAMCILLIWLWMTLRPETYGHLLAVFESDASIFTDALFILQHLPPLQIIFHFLAILGVLIALLSIAISLKDYFEDLRACLQNHHRNWFFRIFVTKRVGALVLIFLPPWLFSLFVTNRYVTVNTFTSVFCEYFLAIVFPIQWVWTVRYIHQSPTKQVLFGGKKLLVFLVFVAATLFFVISVMPINAMY